MKRKAAGLVTRAPRRDLIVTYGSRTLIKRTTAIKECFQIGKVRALIAEHLNVDVKRVTDEAHFTEDLGADWLDRLELMILIEDQFAGLEITDNALYTHDATSIPKQ
jgi:acyl carrier protein